MKKKLKKELVEWAVISVVVAVLLVTGWYRDLAVMVQRGLLAVGVGRPNIEKTVGPADYSMSLWDISEAELVRLERFRGSVVFINFWATWCPPCVAEMPDIHELFLEMGEQVDFVMVSLDKDRDKAERFIEKEGYTFPVYFPTDTIPSVYSISAIPSTYVISIDGQIVMEKKGMSKYNTERFRKFLAGLAANQDTTF
jgi:thiol-disulfide isomerase/thioredoxin